MPLNVFADDWRECLRAHYMHVIRTRDKVTEPSLTVVMRSAGFNETELAEMRVLATAHVDDVPADFVPDLDALNTPPPAEEPRIFPVVADVAPVAEAPVALLVEDEVLVSAVEVDGMPEAEPEPEPVEEVAAEIPLEEELAEPDEDAPQQLSLF